MYFESFHYFANCHVVCFVFKIHKTSKTFDKLKNRYWSYHLSVNTYISITQLHLTFNVEEMLKKCESCLKKSYGENLERLISLTVR